MLKGWVRFVASKEPRNQYLLSVLFDLEGDIYERFTKCSVLAKQLCLYWQLCIPNNFWLLIQNLYSRTVCSPLYIGIYLQLLLSWHDSTATHHWVAFFYLLIPLHKMPRLLFWAYIAHIIRINSYEHSRKNSFTRWKFTTWCKKTSFSLFIQMFFYLLIKNDFSLFLVMK